MKIKAPRSAETFTPAPAKKHTKESSRPAPAPGADTLKAVQQLLQNAFQPAPQAAPPPPPRKHTQESFQPAPQAAPPPPPRKHTQESFQPAPAPGANTLKSVQHLLQHAYQPAPPPKPKALEPKSAFASFASFASKLKEARKLDQTPFQPAPEPSPQPKPKAPKHPPAFSSPPGRSQLPGGDTVRASSFGSDSGFEWSSLSTPSGRSADPGWPDFEIGNYPFTYQEKINGQLYIFTLELVDRDTPVGQGGRPDGRWTTPGYDPTAGDPFATRWATPDYTNYTGGRAGGPSRNPAPAAVQNQAPAPAQNQAPAASSAVQAINNGRTPPNEMLIPMRIIHFFQGFGLEAWDTALALRDVAGLLNDANPLTLPGSILADLIVSPITGKSPGEAMNERSERFTKAGKVLLEQVGAVMKLALDLSTPMQVTYAMQMANDMARDVMDLMNRNQLTAGAVAQIIVARTGQNPGLQAGATVVDAVTNYKQVVAVAAAGDPEKIPMELGRTAFRILDLMVGFAKPTALGRTAPVLDQVFTVQPLRQVDLLSQLNAPGKSVVVKRSNMSLENLAQLTKEMNREFALLTRGDQRMLIAGDKVSVPLSPDQMRQLSQEGWKLTAHSHLSGLTPSVGDAKVLAATPQTSSIIVDSDGGRVSYTPKQGSGGRTDRISTGAKTLDQAQDAAMTLRAGGVIDYIDPIFQNVRANGLGTPGQYNLDGATTMRDVARRNTSLYTGGNTLNATPHDITHATMAGAGGHMNNTVYPDGVNGILVMADNFTMREFMLTYGGDVKKVDFGKYVQDNYLIPAINSDPGKLMDTLQTRMEDAMARFEANDLKRDPSLRPRAVEQTVQGARSLVEASQDHGFLNYANYRYEGIPARGGPNTNIDTPRSLALKEAADAAWKKITDGYMTQNRALTTEGIEDLRELQMREMISNIVPKEQAAMALKDHITYHELLAQQYMAKYPGTKKGDYYNKLGDRFNDRNVILDLRVPTRQEFETKRRELFPNG